MHCCCWSVTLPPPLLLLLLPELCACVCGMCVVHACAACVGTVCVLYMRPQECFYISLCSSLCRSFRSRHVIVLAAVSQLWNVGGMMDVILAVIVATSTAPRTLLGCAWMCGTFALKQTWIGTSRLGSLNVCIFHLTSSSPTCMLSGTIGIGPARGNGLANVIGALVLRGVISVFVRISCGTIRFKRFRSLGAFALRQKYVLCVYAFAVVLIHTIINASVLPCCYCRCHDVCIVD